ncbi:UTRA domain-containing protein [Paraburkholderia sp. BL6669N2]|uniref:UTRA domain-containing protein n=1 Tax=Paraburkholderia sp. BL6669N2 TaxID=1938807 RepID=UPI001C6E17F8|nr:UTRA domain-containing protein [Paraburkholderia sp. BL6669N2]
MPNAVVQRVIAPVNRSTVQGAANFCGEPGAGSRSTTIETVLSASRYSSSFSMRCAVMARPWWKLVEQKFGRTAREVRQEIRAMGIPARLAKPLGAEVDGDALEITRRYVDDRGVVFEAAASVYPANRFTYALQLRR